VVRVDVCFVTVTKLEKNNIEQRYAIKFRVRLGEGTTDAYEKIQKAFGNDYHVLKYFGGTKTL
jgi:hypothetical protein